MAVYLIPTILGMSLLWKFPRNDNEYGVLFGYYIVCHSHLHPPKSTPLTTSRFPHIQTGSFVTSLVLALQLPSSNMGGYTKRVTSTAMVFLAYCIGNIIGPRAFLDNEAPIYPTACKLCIACAVCQIVCAMVLRCLLVWRNRQRDRIAGSGGGSAAAAADLCTDEAMEDLTDFENQRFRYVL